MIKTEGSMVPV